MKIDSRAVGLCVFSVASAVAYHLAVPAEYPRVGLLAGAGAGVVFGSTVPVEPFVGARLHRAIRTAVAFSATTGIGFGVYQGWSVGVSWFVGGFLGCVAGVLTAQIVRRSTAGTDDEGS